MRVLLRDLDHEPGDVGPADLPGGVLDHVLALDGANLALCSKIKKNSLFTLNIKIHSYVL